MTARRFPTEDAQGDFTAEGDLAIAEAPQLAHVAGDPFTIGRREDS